MVAAIDAVLVSQNVALAAESCGLGICYMGSTLANCDQIGRILQLLELVGGIREVLGVDVADGDDFDVFGLQGCLGVDHAVPPHTDHAHLQ